MKKIIYTIFLLTAILLGYQYGKQEKYPTFLFIDYQKDLEGNRGFGNFYCKNGELISVDGSFTKKFLLPYLIREEDLILLEEFLKK